MRIIQCHEKLGRCLSCALRKPGIRPAEARRRSTLRLMAVSTLYLGTDTASSFLASPFSRRDQRSPITRIATHNKTRNPGLDWLIFHQPEHQTQDPPPKPGGMTEQSWWRIEKKEAKLLTSCDKRPPTPDAFRGPFPDMDSRPNNLTPSTPPAPLHIRSWDFVALNDAFLTRLARSRLGCCMRRS
jgi:hypothetical protein